MKNLATLIFTIVLFLSCKLQPKKPIIDDFCKELLLNYMNTEVTVKGTLKNLDGKGNPYLVDKKGNRLFIATKNQNHSILISTHYSGIITYRPKAKPKNLKMHTQEAYGEFYYLIVSGAYTKIRKISEEEMKNIDIPSADRLE